MTDRQDSAFARRIDVLADGAARMYLAGLEHGQSDTLEVKRIIETILSPSYDGRTVIELLQNGHDAHPPDVVDGALEFLLTEDDGEHGSLYVANHGIPILEENLVSLCRVGMSSKRPDQAIGHKGVGFKSVLNITDAPELYSKADIASAGFDGYCLRFAHDDDYDALAERIDPTRADLARELHENVARLKLPFPINTVPPAVRSFADRAVTVIRLPLKDPSAYMRTREQLEELLDADLPLNLFLPRVSTITVNIESHENPRSVQLERVVQEELRTGRVRTSKVLLQDDRTFLMLHRTVPEATITQAIAESGSRLPEDWQKWQGDAAVSIALPLDHDLTSGRLYAFLPMGVSATAPFAALVNAPFFPDVDRKDLSLGVPLNGMWMSELACLAADALAASHQRRLHLEPQQQLDLACWTGPGLDQVTAGLATHELDLDKLPIIPSLNTPVCSLSEALVWESGTTSEFTTEAVSTVGVARLVDVNAVGSSRMVRLNALANRRGLPLGTSVEDLAIMAEAVAVRLHALEASGERWADFYDDLSSYAGLDARCSGRTLLITADGELCAADRSDGRTVFLSPSPDEDGEVPNDVPPGISQRLAFLRADVPTRVGGAGSRNRTGRNWLVTGGLAREYRTDQVLNVAGRVMRESADTDEDGRQETLEFAFRVWNTAKRDVGGDAMRGARLLLPTASGWLPATETLFGNGWEGPLADTDRALQRLVGRVDEASSELADLRHRLLVEPQAMSRDARDDSLNRWRTFCERAGAVHGLPLVAEPSTSWRQNGNDLIPPFTVRIPWGVPQTWRERLTAAFALWGTGRASYSSVDYLPTTAVSRLVGQWEFERLEDKARLDYSLLVLSGLERWSDTVLTIRFTRSSDPAGPVMPSPLAVFIRTAAWIPQSTPGDRSTITFSTAVAAWWVHLQTTPDFLPAEPPLFGRVAGDKALARLRECGVRVWHEPESARERLTQLADIVGLGTIEARSILMLSVRAEVERAWRDLIAIGSQPGSRQVVFRLGQLGVTKLGQEPVHVPDPEGERRREILDQTAAAILPIRDPALGQQILNAYAAYQLVAASAVDARVQVDGAWADELGGAPLLDVMPPWLLPLTLAVVQTKHRGTPMVSDHLLRRVADELQQAKLLVADQIITFIGSTPAPRTTPGSQYVRTSDGARVIVSRPDEPSEIVHLAAAGITELIRLPGLADNLRLAGYLLRSWAEDDQVDQALIERSVDAPAGSLAELHQLRASGGRDWTRIVATLAMLDEDAARSLRDRTDHGLEPESLPEVLAELAEATQLSWRPEVVIAASEQPELHDALELLGVSLSHANGGLRALGLPTLRNEQGLRRDFETLLQGRRSLIETALRDRFLPRVHKEGDVARALYARLRDLATLDLDPTWLEEYWELPPDSFDNRVTQWLDQHAPIVPTEVGSPSAGITELRDTGRRVIVSVLTNARLLIAAWVRKHGGQAPELPADSGVVIESMTREGRLDFERLTAAPVVAWLASHYGWPEGMPKTLTRSQLGLTALDIDQTRATLEQQKQATQAAARSVSFGSTRYTDEPDDQRALADAVQEQASLLVFQQSLQPLELLPAESSVRRRRGTRTGRAGRAAQADPALTRSIGLAGEVIVAEWILQQTGLPRDVTWQSGYRSDILGDGEGSDSYGYDFAVPLDDETLLLEVKASVDEVHEFQLNETEVHRAQSLAPHETYLVVAVSHVLNPAQCRITPLPNPLGFAGLRHYEVVGRALRLRYNLAEVELGDEG